MAGERIFRPQTAGTRRQPSGSIPLSLLSRLWRYRRLAAAATVGVAGLSGLLVAFAMPRGPVTALQALALVLTGFAVGVVAGLVLRSRWAMLLAPVAHVVGLELGRLGANLPTVAGIHLDTTFGILAFILGRGVYGLLGLLPMVLGVVYGRALARQLTPEPARSHGRRFWHYARYAVTGFLTVALVALVALIAWPGSTPPILAANGKPLPGSIAELTKVRLGGHDQWIEIRGANINNAVLLYLTGGPGQSDLPFSRVFFADLAQDFVVVGWDQRGTGKSYPALDPATLTLEQAVSDTIELTNYLRDRFHQEKIYLLGESWGTTLGVLAVQRHPELFYAYIGSGQMVSQRETDQRLYQDVLAYAERIGDTALARQMRAYGPPPYKDLWAYGVVMQQYDKLAGPYTPPPAYEERGSASGIGPWGVLGSEYTLIEKVNVVRGLIDMFSVMYPHLQGIDFRVDVPRLEVPVYILDGEHELSARRDLALDWFNQLQAPSKQLFMFADAGHAVAFEEFQAFHQIMTGTVLPETYARR